MAVLSLPCQLFPGVLYVRLKFSTWTDTAMNAQRNNAHRMEDPYQYIHFKRSSRIVHDDDGFHYRTREGELVGPFSTEAKAKYDLNTFLKVVAIEKELGEDIDLLKDWS